MNATCWFLCCHSTIICLLVTVAIHQHHHQFLCFSDWSDYYSIWWNFLGLYLVTVTFRGFGRSIFVLFCGVLHIRVVFCLPFFLTCISPAVCAAEWSVWILHSLGVVFAYLRGLNMLRSEMIKQLTDLHNIMTNFENESNPPTDDDDTVAAAAADDDNVCWSLLIISRYCRWRILWTSLNKLLRMN